MNTESRSRAFIVQVMAVVCIAVLFAAWWKQRADLSRIRGDYGRLREQNEGLQQDLTQARAEPGRSAAAHAQVQPQASKGHDAQEPRPGAAALQPKAHPPAPEPNRLALAGAEVNPIPNGLVTTMRFSASKAGPLGILALVIRLPRDGDATILDLAPVGSTTYADVAKRVSEDGKFAVFQGTMGEATDAQFALSVSGPATADVRGTCGIEPFQLDIQPTGAKIRGK
jgi:hypothetical protein